MGGLARTLEAMPADFEGRQDYVDIFQAMAGRIRDLQQDDGLARQPAGPRALSAGRNLGLGLLRLRHGLGINHGLLDPGDL